MFTGIVAELGEVVSIERLGSAGRLTIRGPQVSAEAAPGDSIAVNGVCLTAVTVAGGQFSADVMAETLSRSSLAALSAGSPVNLEPALTPASRLGGHLVQGHVDGTGSILERVPGERSELVRISLPRQLARYVVEKGSIAVDGVSLTVVAVRGTEFTVGLVPATLAVTTLGRKGLGAPVNLEVDVLAKYVEKLLASTEGHRA